MNFIYFCLEGTLSKFLSQHPSIVIHETPESGFYSTARNIEKGEIFHASSMPVSTQHQLGLENAPMYFTRQFALDHLAAANKNASYILILREPVERAVSHFLQYSRMIVRTSKNLSNEFAKQAFFRNGSVNLGMNTIIRNGLYSKYFKVCMQYLPISKIHVVDGDEFAKNPLPALKELERFLKIPSYFNMSMFVYVEKKRFYCLRNKDGSPACMSDKKGRRHPQIDNGTRTRLKNFFQPYNEELFKLIGKRFDWQ